jgi:hypothetical protein
MQQDKWKTDWLTFVEYVADAANRGLTSEELSREVESQQIQWQGRVRLIKLDNEYVPGIGLRMESVQRTLDNGVVLSASYLFLKVEDRTQHDVLRHLKVGDRLAFVTTFDAANGIFPVLNLDYDEPDRIIHVRLSVHGVQLIN